MALDMFIRIDGLAGESLDKTHRGEIDVLAWRWGISNAGSAHTGGGAGSGKADVHDLSFTKWVDKSTPDLLLSACSGRHWNEARLTVRKSVDTGGSGKDDRLVETVTLNFAAVAVDYVEQTAKGGAGAKPSMHWNVAENAKE